MHVLRLIDHLVLARTRAKSARRERNLPTWSVRQQKMIADWSQHHRISAKALPSCSCSRKQRRGHIQAAAKPTGVALPPHGVLVRVVRRQRRRTRKMAQEDDVPGSAAAAATNTKKDDDVEEDMFASEVDGGGEGEDVLGPLETSNRARTSFVMAPLSRSIAVVSGSAKSTEGRNLEGSLITDSALQLERSERSFMRASRSASLPPQRLSKGGALGGRDESHLALLVRARHQSTRMLQSEIGHGAKMLAGFESLSTVDENLDDVHEIP